SSERYWLCESAWHSRCGKGYVPLNATFPPERTRRMLDLSECETLIFGREGSQQLSEILMKLHRSLTVILPDTPDANTLSKDFAQHRFVSAREMSGATSFHSSPRAPPRT